MTSRKSRKGKKPAAEPLEDYESELADEASASSPRLGCSASPSPSYDDTGTENEDDQANLTTILKELRAVGKEVKEFRKDTKQQLLDIRSELDKTNARLDEVETRVADHEDKLQNSDDLLAAMILAQEQLQNKLMSLDANSRREMLRLYGVPEGAESGASSMTQFVEKLLRENLNIPSSTVLQIQKAYRASATPPPDGSQPRSILVKFLCYTVKEEVLRLAWQKKGLVWHNSKISLDHDYPPEIMARRREYAEVRRILKEKNLRFRTIYPARLKVFYEEGTKIYSTVEDATADMASRGFPVKIIQPPATLKEKLQRWSTWTGVVGRRERRSGQAAGYKERLQAFRRDDN